MQVKETSPAGTVNTPHQSLQPFCNEPTLSLQYICIHIVHICILIVNELRLAILNYVMLFHYQSECILTFNW